MKVEVIDLVKREDMRGHLFEILRNQGQMPQEKFGLIYYNVVNPGITKGNHYHLRKTEWYCIVSGKAKVRLRDRKIGETQEVILTGDHPQLIRLDRNVTHNITNIGVSEMHFIGYIDEPYNPADPDTYPELLSQD